MMNFDGLVLATRDTHGEDYLERQEGKKLPVVHCIKGTHGWEIKDEIQQAAGSHSQLTNQRSAVRHWEMY